MSSPIIAIGCDSSKGRIDVEIRNEHGTVLHIGVFDDAPDDHAALRQVVDALRERFPTTMFLAGRVSRTATPTSSPSTSAAAWPRPR